MSFPLRTGIYYGSKLGHSTMIEPLLAIGPENGVSLAFLLILCSSDMDRIERRALFCHSWELEARLVIGQERADVIAKR